MFLKLLFPQSRAVTIAAAGIGQDQQLVRRREGRLSFRLPPGGNRFDGKLGCVRRTTDIDIALIVEQVVDAIRHSSTESVLLEVMHVYVRGRLTPAASRVLEIADQLLFLRIHADNGQARLPKGFHFARDVLELFFALWMGRSAQAFDVGFQGVVHLFQQAPNAGMTDHMRGRQRLAQMPQATSSTNACKSLKSMGSFFRPAASHHQATGPARQADS